MAEIPSWLNPPNFLGAMEGGARLGLAERGQDIEEKNTADRLRLAYDQLAKQERLATMQNIAKMKLGEAGLAIKQAHEDALSQHYKAMQSRQDELVHNQQSAMQMRQSQIDETERHNKATEARREETPPGSVTFDKFGNPTEFKGPPGSASIDFMNQRLTKQKKVDALPKHTILRSRKLTSDNAKMFLDAAEGDKDEAIKLAKERGWDVEK